MFQLGTHVYSRNLMPKINLYVLVFSCLSNQYKRRKGKIQMTKPKLICLSEITNSSTLNNSGSIFHLKMHKCQRTFLGLLHRCFKHRSLFHQLSGSIFLLFACWVGCHILACWFSYPVYKPIMVVLGGHLYANDIL